MVRDMLNGTKLRVPPSKKSLPAREAPPMALKVSCPNCLSLLQVPRKLRGKVVVCPCCKEKCRVPLPSTVGASPAGVIVREEVVAEAQVKAYDPARGTWIR